MAEYKVQRRVAGEHDFRLDGMADLLHRARGVSVLDIGCNRGMVGLEFARNGANKVHGLDIYEPGIAAAREVFADIRSVDSRFEVCDLTRGPEHLPLTGNYDIVLCLATYHKLKRVMAADALSSLFVQFGSMTKGYFGWRATSDKPDENDQEMKALDRDLGDAGLRRIHTSYISTELGVAAIWARV